MMRKSAGVLAVVGAALMVAATAASASIVSVGGAIVQIAPPPSVSINVLESDTQMFAFDEQQNVALAADLPVDISVPGVYDETADLTPGTIPAGTMVKSHFVHVDKFGAGGGGLNLEGTLVTDTDILGISVLAANLDASDVLGAPGTFYPTGAFQRQINLEGNDFIIEQPDRRTVVIHSNINAHIDHVRVIAAGDPPPSGGEGCTPGYWKQKQHFDSWVGYTPGQSFEAVFGRDAYSGSPTLQQALSSGGGGVFALGRHATAALLNASSGGVDYSYTTAQVISLYQVAFDGGAAAVESTKNIFEAENELGCPLN